MRSADILPFFLPSLASAMIVASPVRTPALPAAAPMLPCSQGMVVPTKASSHILPYGGWRGVRVVVSVDWEGSGFDDEDMAAFRQFRESRGAADKLLLQVMRACFVADYREIA